MAMTKADIVERVTIRCGCTRKEAIEYVETMFRIMKNTLESGEEIMVSGFGKFTVKQKNARRGRNPQTGEAITLDPRKVLSFKASPLLRKNINLNP